MKKSLAEYHTLIDLFEEFRELIKPKVINGVPDFTAVAMERQHSGLRLLQNRLGTIEISNWDISKQVDYHVVRAEMNGVEFDHSVLNNGHVIQVFITFLMVFILVYWFITHEVFLIGGYMNHQYHFQKKIRKISK